MKAKTTLRSFLAITGSSLLAISSASATVYYWDSNSTSAGFGNTNGTWGTSLFWSTDSTGVSATAATAITAADDVNFGTATDGYTGGRTVTIDTTQTANSVTIGSASGATTFSGGTALNLGNANTVITQNSASDTTISTAIGGGTNGLTKEGTGRLILTGLNSSTGNTVVNGGILRFGSAYNSSWSTGNRSLNVDSNLKINNAIVEAWYYATRTLGTGAGEIQLTGGRAGFSNLQGDNTGSPFITFTTTGTTVTWGSAVFNPTTLVLNDAAGVSTSVLRMNNVLDLGGAARTIEVASTGVGAGRGTYATWDGNISNGSLLKTGAGTLLLGGTNSYGGGTSINNGGLWFNSLVSMPNTGAVEVNTGGILSVSVGGTGQWTTGTSGTGTIGGLLAGLGGQSGGTVSYSGNVAVGFNAASNQTYAGNIGDVGASLAIHIGNKDSGTFADPFTAAGTITFSGNNNYSGGTRINRGTLLVDSANALGTTGNITFGGGTLQYNANSTANDYTNRIKGSTSAITLDTNGQNLSFAGAIDNTNTGGLTKTGLGTLILTGANTYTGATTVNVGTLQLDMTGSGSLASTSALTLGGGNFTIKGGATSAQTLGALNLTNYTSSRITLDPNNGTSTTLTLGNAWTRGGGSSLLIDYSSSNTGTREVVTAAATTGYTLSNGIYGGILVKDSAGVTGFATRAAGATQAITRFDDTTGTTLAVDSNAAVTNFSTLNSTYAAGILTWTDGGLLTTRAVNSLTIDTTNNGGTIDMGASGNVLTLTSLGILFKGGNNSILTGGQVGANNSEVIVHQTGAGTLTINSLIGSGGASLTKDGSGTLIVGGTNTFTGATRVNEGALRLANANATGTTGNGITVLNGAALELTGALTYVADALTLNGSGISNGGALRNISGANTYPGAITVGSGGARINNDDAGNALIVRGITTALGADVTFGGAGNITHNTTAITGIGNLIKDGAGELNLSLANTFSGSTTVSAGILNLTNASALQNSTLDTANSVAGSASAGLKTTATTLALAGITGNKNFAATGGVFTTSGGYGSVTALTLNPATGQSNSYSGAIENGVSGMTLTKNGAGTQLLNGTNTYTGLTTVNQGTLGGSGTIAGAVTVNATGSLAPGASAGTLAITGALTLTSQVNGGTGKLKFELASIAASDKITVGGNLTLGGNFLAFNDFEFSTLAGLQDGTYTLVSYGGTLSGGLDTTPANLTGAIGLGTGTLQLNAIDKTIELVVTGTGGGGNTAPTISDIANPPSFPSGGNTGALAFTVGDENPASVVASGTSSNTGLVPNGNIVFGGSGANRTVTVTPVSGLSGSATITVTLTDNGSLTVQDTFTVTVTDNYLSWATANGVTGGVNGDSDNDGVKNLVEYALVNGGERGVLSGYTITFTKRGGVYGSDVTYDIESSTDLSTWGLLAKPTPVTETSGSISYTFTPSTPVKNFARLKVVQVP